MLQLNEDEKSGYAAETKYLNHKKMHACSLKAATGSRDNKGYFSAIFSFS